MIDANATLTIQRIALSQLQVIETESCFPAKFDIYLQLLRDNPDLDVEPLIVTASPTHENMFAIKNGKHRFCASIMAGRRDVLCIIEEKGNTSGRSQD